MADRVACVAWLGLLASCADLSPIQTGVCGNGVVEPESGEDCDRFPEGQCRPPGSLGECRYDCSERTDGTRPECPPGWGCGTDDTCRQPAGTYEPSGGSQMPAPSQLRAGDFDGDGYVDLLVSNNQAVGLLFTDEDGSFASHTSVPPSNFTPAVGDLSDDGLDDVALLYDGLIIGRGRTDETVQPTVSSPYVLPNLPGRPVLFDARPTEFDAATHSYMWQGDELLMFLGTDIYHAEAGADVDWNGKLPASAGDIIGDVQVGNLFESVDESPCLEVAAAFKDETWVWVYTPCRVTAPGKVDWNEAPGPGVPIDLPKVQLPMGATAGGVLLADLNGDGHLDMLISPPDMSGGGIESSPGMVAYGNGTGTFHSNPSYLPVAPDKGDNQAVIVTAPLFGNPIAVGDLDGDPCADIVTQHAVFVTSPHCPSGVKSIDEITYRPIAGAGIGTWDFARIADLNANGIPDVVAGSTTSAQLTFFNGAGEGIFNQFGIPLDAPANSLAIGDFDGDLIQDIAFREAGPHGDVATDVEKGDSLAISFGNGFGAPSPPVNMGRLARIQYVVGGNLAGFHADGIQDLVVVSKSEDESATSAAVLGGASDRQMFSPFTFTLLDDETPYTAVAVAIGQFDGDPDDHPDIAALTIVDTSYDSMGPQEGPGGGLGSSGEVHLWLVPTTGEASLDASTETRSESIAKQDVFQIPLLNAVDLGSDGGELDGIDEVVALSTAYDQMTYMPSGALLVAHVEDVGGKKTWVAGGIQKLPVLFFSGSGGGGSVGGIPGTYTKEDVWSYSGDVELGDVDSDGAIDVVGLGLTFDDQLGVGTSTNIVLLRNTRSGTLDASSAIVFPNPDDRNPTAIALLNADGDKELEIAVAESDRGYVADFDLAEGKLVAMRPVPALRGGQALIAADFDADGIDDLAYATADRVTLLLGGAVVK